MKTLVKVAALVAALGLVVAPVSTAFAGKNNGGNAGGGPGTSGNGDKATPGKGGGGAGGGNVPVSRGGARGGGK